MSLRIDTKCIKASNTRTSSAALIALFRDDRHCRAFQFPGGGICAGIHK